MPEISITLNNKETNLFPYLVGLTTVLAILKLVDWITLSWLGVFAPLWFTTGVFLLIFVYFIIIGEGKLTITNFITGTKKVFRR